MTFYKTALQWGILCTSARILEPNRETVDPLIGSNSLGTDMLDRGAHLLRLILVSRYRVNNRNMLLQRGPFLSTYRTSFNMQQRL